MTITIDRENFRNAVAAVALAMHDDERAHANKCGVALEIADDGKALDIVATNDHWLARWREPILAGAESNTARVLVHARDVAVLRAWLKSKAKRGVVEVDFAGTCTADQASHAFKPVDVDPPCFASLFAVVEPEPVVTAPRSVAIAGRYVAAIVKAFALAGAEPIFRLGAERDAVLVRARYCPLTCVVMPVAVRAPQGGAS